LTTRPTAGRAAPAVAGPSAPADLHGPAATGLSRRGPVVARRTTRRRAPLTAYRLKRLAVPWLFLAPALLIFTAFKFVPMVRAVDMSFYTVRPYLGNEPVGLANYREVLTNPDFLSAIWHTVVLAVGQSGGALILGLILALLLEGTARYLWFVRTAVFLPVVTAIAVVAEVWRILYYPGTDGVLNTILGWLQLGPSKFLDSADTSLGSVIVVGIWRQAPYDMMIFLAGLAIVDRNLYEAAATDGAGTLRRLWHVTFPALRPVFLIVITLAAIRGMRVFTEVFLLTNGDPAGSSEVLMTLIYKVGFERFELGIAAAGSVLLLLATGVLTLAVQFVRSRADLRGSLR
jgi:multiple sugar transport system permease protein